MRLSTRGRYGLSAAYYMGKRYGEDPLSLRELSQMTWISESYLEQLIRRLKEAGLVTSVRGPRGGYLLTRQPEDISIRELLFYLEDFFSPTECVLVSGICSREKECPLRNIWLVMSNAINSTLDNISLQDLIEGKVMENNAF